MPRKRLQRYLPSPGQIRKNPALKPVAHLLSNSEIWHLNRRSAAGAVFIGLFCGFLPVPLQMVIAAGLAVVTRCNLPISVALVWITNPLTFAPIFYFTYRLGAWLLDMELLADSVDLNITWIWDNLGSIGYPLLFGSVLCGWVAGLTGFVATRLVWRMHVIRRWKARRARLKLRRESRKNSKQKVAGQP